METRLDKWRILASASTYCEFLSCGIIQSFARYSAGGSLLGIYLWFVGRADLGIIFLFGTGFVCLGFDALFSFVHFGRHDHPK